MKNRKFAGIKMISRLNLDIEKAAMIYIRCLKFNVGRASVMAIFIGTKINSGQVSVCGDTYRGSTLLPRQHLALFVSNDRLRARISSDRDRGHR